MQTARRREAPNGLGPPARRSDPWTEGGRDDGLLTLLGIPKNDTYIDGYLALAGATPFLKDLVAAGDLDILTAFEVFLFDSAHQDAAARFISGIKLGTKRSNRLLSMVREIALRDGINPESIMNAPEIVRIYTSEMDLSHKGKKVLEAIENLRYPAMTEYKKEFYRRLKKAGLDPALNLVLPHDFEKWEFTMNFSFSSEEEFQKKAALLADLASTHALAELLEFRY